MTDYKPGLYAVTSWRGENQLAFRTERGEDVRWCVLDGADTRGLSDDEVRDVHPLVVLDLKYPADMLQTLREAAHVMDEYAEPLTNLADQIEAQTKPPKPAEPTGLGAVVEDSEGVCWVRAGNAAHVALMNCWRATAGEYVGDWQTFDRIDVVRVLSEGVES